MSCAETIQVSVDGGGDEDYHTLLAKAMHRVSDFLPDAQIHRSEGDCGGVGGMGSGEEWYLACAHCQVSPGGGKIGGAFQFARYKGL